MAAAEFGQVGSRRWAQHLLMTKIQEVLRFAAQNDFVVTIENKPLSPLAQGNHMPDVCVRDSQSYYRKEQQ